MTRLREKERRTFFSKVLCVRLCLTVCVIDSLTNVKIVEEARELMLFCGKSCILYSILIVMSAYNYFL